MLDAIKQLESAILSGEEVKIPPFVDAWLKRKQKLFIQGKWVETNETFPTINPATETRLSEVCVAGKQEVQTAVQFGRQVFESGVWASQTMEDRAAVIRAIGDLILLHRPILALLETLDTGKPIRESFEGDVLRAASNFQFFADYSKENTDLVFQNGVDTHRAFREPLGVVALITPWNLPLYLETWKIAPALLMGNSVILKPSELTPLTAIYFTELLSQTKLPAGVFQLIQGFGENAAGEFLVSHPGIDAISFTGETSTGRAIMKSAAHGPTRVSFELGGKGASVVFKDADLEKTASEVLRAGTRNQGEICLACPRVYIERAIYSQFVEKLKILAEKIQVGSPLSYQTGMGALIGKEHYEKVTGYLKRVEPPARFVTGGARPESMGKGYFLKPTIIEGLSESHPITREEVFGPVLSVYPFDGEEEAARLVNNTQYGLSCSIWTEDLAKAERVAKRVRIGLVWINCWFVRDLRVPFGGQKKSGLGREGGRHSLDFYSEWKSVCVKGK